MASVWEFGGVLGLEKKVNEKKRMVKNDKMVKDFFKNFICIFLFVCINNSSPRLKWTVGF